MNQRPETDFNFSRHANVRIRQRGIDEAALALVLEHGDDSPAGAGVHRRLTSQRLAELTHDVDDAMLLERASRLVAVINPSETVVTAYKSDPRRRRKPRAGSFRRALSRARVR